MWDKRPIRELRALHTAFEAKYGKTPIHRWLMERGKAHIEICNKK